MIEYIILILVRKVVKIVKGKDPQVVNNQSLPIRYDTNGHLIVHSSDWRRVAPLSEHHVAFDENRMERVHEVSCWKEFNRVELPNNGFCTECVREFCAIF